MLLLQLVNLLRLLPIFGVVVVVVVYFFCCDSIWLLLVNGLIAVGFRVKRDVWVQDVLVFPFTSSTAKEDESNLIESSTAFSEI